MTPHPSEISNEDIYVAVLRFAFRDQFLDGEEMAWMQRISTLLGVDKAVRGELMKDIKYQARMNQLPPPSEKEGPLDLYRSVCARAWVGTGLGSEEVEALAEFAQVLQISRYDAETCLAETAPTGKMPPSLEGMVPEPKAPEPSAEEDLSEKQKSPGFSPVLLGALLIALAVMVYVGRMLLFG